MSAFAKVNLALVVGCSARTEIEVATVLRDVDYDDVELERADRLTVHGFSEDTLSSRRAPGARHGVRSRATLERADREADPRRGRSRGRSADAAAAPSLRTRSCRACSSQPSCTGWQRRSAPTCRPSSAQGRISAPETASDLADSTSHGLRRSAHPAGRRYEDGDADVYRRFDEQADVGFDDRRATLLSALRVSHGPPTAALPRNDLASSLSHDLVRLARSAPT